jgi:integrin alpha FG-GAP repeat containing protein 1
MTIPARSASLTLLLLPFVKAIWPFQQKRFSAEALIDAGQLGFEGVDGRVVAVGDWNGDKK